MSIRLMDSNQDLSDESHGPKESNAAFCVLCQLALWIYVYIKCKISQLHFTEVVHQWNSQFIENLILEGHHGERYDNVTY